MPSIYDVQEIDVRDLSDHDLTVMDNRTHKVFTHDLKNAANDHRMAKLLLAILRVHSFLIDEFVRRGLTHPMKDSPPIPKQQEKIRTEFGEFVREATVGSLPGIRISLEDAKKLADGDASFLILPDVPDSRSIEDSPIPKAVVMTGGDAIGTVNLLGGLQPVTRERARFAITTIDKADPWKAIGIAYIPFVSNVNVERERNVVGGILRPGTFKLTKPALQKQRRAALAFTFDKNDRVLLVERTTPPLVWSPPGGFVMADESVVDAAKREALEETDVEMESAFESRDLLDVGSGSLTAVVGRAKATVPILTTDEVSDAKWVELTDLHTVRPLSPGRLSILRALNDLRSFEVRVKDDHGDLNNINSADITPAFLAPFNDNKVREIDDLLHDRFANFDAREIDTKPTVDAHIVVLAEHKKRGLQHTSSDPLDDATRRAVEKEPEVKGAE